MKKVIISICALFLMSQMCAMDRRHESSVAANILKTFNDGSMPRTLFANNTGAQVFRYTAGATCCIVITSKCPSIPLATAVGCCCIYLPSCIRTK